MPNIKSYKLVRTFYCCAAAAIGCTALSACYKPDIPQKDREYVAVTVVDGSTYRAENGIQKIKRGSSAVINLVLDEGYVFSDCDYGDYDVKEERDGKVSLVLNNVMYPCRLHVVTEYIAPAPPETSGYIIDYDLNGGVDSDGNDSFTATYAPGKRLRINTSTATDVVRDGYALVGWNTESDGSGERVGLGSRITVVKDTPLKLYAQWLKWSDGQDFKYEIAQDSAYVTGYAGLIDVSRLVIPSELGGKPVVSIAGGFADNLRVNTLVIPSTVKTIEPSAFVDCSIEEIIFSDTLENVSDSSFGYEAIPVWRINAVKRPVFLSRMDFTYFSDNMDRLMLSRDKKKMVFFAGCSMGYGLNSPAVAESFSDYEIFNFGLLGGSDAGVQLDMITSSVGEGDVFVHAPEEGSTYQLMLDRTADLRIFVLVEGNYDLISFADMSGVKQAFDSFASFNTVRKNFPYGNYTDCLDTYNEYGDFIGKHPDGGEDKPIGSEPYTFIVDKISRGTLLELCKKYHNISEKGAEVLFSFAPINYHGLPWEDVDREIWYEYQSLCEQNLGMYGGYRVISSVKDYVMEGRYFYDSDYHLGEGGAALRTARLIEDLKRHLGGRGFEK